VRNVARVLAVLAALLLPPPPLQAQDQPPIEVTATSVHYTFGQQVTFDIGASADSSITAIYLHLQQEGETRDEVLPISFEPEASVQSSFQLDLRLHPFPPFGLVTWWWEVLDASGDDLATPPSVFRYVDNRFEWQSLSAGPVHVHVVVDDPAYAQAALDIAQAGLTQITNGLQSPSPETVDIYLYPSLADLQAAMEMGGRSWVGGQARPELGVVLVAIPYDDEYVARMERDIPHEIAHLVVYQAVGPEGYVHVPTWLNEGVAMTNQLHSDPSLDALLEQARAEGRLIPLTDLCPPFPSDPEVALLSYAQSASLVGYVRDRYGNAGIRALLAAYADGAGCEGGIIQALDTTPQRLELAWRAYLVGASGWTVWLSDHTPWLVFWGLSLLLALPMAGSMRRRQG